MCEHLAIKMLQIFSPILIVFSFTTAQLLSDEVIYTINSKKALHCVNERFLSISLDPAVLLTNFNLSETSLELAKHLNPAFIRIAGPSTRFVKYLDNDLASEEEEETTGNVIVTPSMWFGINEWFTLANLTPVFGINDMHTTNGVWNPKSTLPLLEISDKLNVTCYWQLGYDCSNKTEMQYKKDLSIFRHFLDAFPDKKDSWKIVGSDLSRCIGQDHLDTTRRTMEDLEGILTAITWESAVNSDASIFENPIIARLASPIKSKVAVWTAAPKCPHPISFSSAISWAKQLGEAARVGFDVIFRQPRLHEVFSETPAYWVSVLHKALMGQNVLDVKLATTSSHSSSVSTYAHCTKHQNNFVRSGAITVLMINNGTSNHTIYLRLGTVSLKNIEVQSYILTSPSEDSTEIYLNDHKLSLKNFDGDKMNILPKLRRAHIMNYLSLSLPGKSMGFFVLPAARVPVCINEETEMNLLMEEIGQDQKIPFSEEVSVEVTPRFALHKSPTLRQLQELMEKEMESDERFYKKMAMKKNAHMKKITDERNHPPDARNYFLERARLVERQRKQFDTEHRKNDLMHLIKHKEAEPKRELELELTSEEIRKVLADRAKVKAQKKHIIFTSEELEEIMDKATEKFLKNRNTAIKITRKTKRATTRDKKDINMRLLKLKSLGEKRKLLMKQLAHRNDRTQNNKREKRDINLDLLKLRSELLQSKNHKKSLKKTFEDKAEKVATIRESDQTSAEILNDYEELDKDSDSPIPDGEVFAEIAKSDELTPETPKRKFLLEVKPKYRLNNAFLIPKPKIPKLAIIKHDNKVRTDTVPLDKTFTDVPEEEYEEEASSLDDTQFPCIHEFFGPEIEISNRNNDEMSEILEIGEVETERNSQQYEDTPTTEKYTRVPDVDGISDYGDLDSDDTEPFKLKKRSISESDEANKADGRISFILPGKIGENIKDQQMRMLKKRLAYKKKLSIIEKGNRIIENGFHNKRPTRSILGMDTNVFNKRYKSLTEGLKEWKPSDILSLPKRNSHGKLSRRSVDNGVDSVENEIDSFMNEIKKESILFQPKLDGENGDYQLIFPNKDQIQIAEKHGDTELKLLLHGNQVDDSRPREITTEEAGVVTAIMKDNTNDSAHHIMDIRVGNVWEKLFDKVSDFFKGLSEKLKAYLFQEVVREP